MASRDRQFRASLVVSRFTALASNCRTIVSALAALALLFPGVTTAQEKWSFDPTFQRTPLRVTSESASGVKVLSSGKVLVYSMNGLLMSGANGQRTGALLRIDPVTGALDPTWTADPTLTGRGFLGVAEAPDGKIYYSTALTGELHAIASDPAVYRLVRLNLDGSRDRSFNSPIFGTAARFLAVQPDGKIIVCAGGSNQFGTLPADSIVQTVRLNTDGSLDPSFQSPNFQSSATNPPVTVSNYRDSGILGNPLVDPATGKIYFCGTFRFVNGQPRKSIVRCNPDGTLDSSFVPTGMIAGTAGLNARAMVLQPGGKVVLGGINLRTAAGGSTRYALLRFNSDGALDSTFSLVPTTTSSGVALVAGYFGPHWIRALPSGDLLSSGTRVLRFLPEGSVDSTFTALDYSSPFPANNFGSVGAFRFDVEPSTGVAFFANPGRRYTRLNGVEVGSITKLTATGAIDTQFNSPVIESENFAPDVQLGPGGSVYVSGSHTDFGNAANATITRLLADGTRDATYSLGVPPFPDKKAAEFALLPDGAAYAAYDSGAFHGAYLFSNLVRLSPTGALDPSFRLSDTLQTALGINAFDATDLSKNALPMISPAPNGKAYLFSHGDPQTTVNANGNLKPTRVNADGTEDTSVPALGFRVGDVTRDASSQQITGGSTGYLERLTQTADGGLIMLASVAPFPTSTGEPYNYRIIKLRSDGSVDPNFASPSLASTLSPFLSFPFLFDPVTQQSFQPANGFYSAPDQPVSSVAVAPDGSIVLAGKFRLTGGSATYSLAKLTAAGELDSAFSPPVPGAENRARPARPALITNVRLAPDGKIWVVGRFDTFGGSPAPGVARLHPGGTLDSTFQLSGVEYYDSFGDNTDIVVGDRADVVFANNTTAYLVGTFRRPGEPMPFAVTRIVNPPDLALGSAVSRKVHGTAGTFDLDLPLGGSPGVECRSTGGAHTLVFTFNNNVASGSATVTAGTGNVSGSPVPANNSLTVNLVGVSDQQQVAVKLSNVIDTFGQVLPDTAVSVNFLIGDTNRNRTVSASDIGQTKAQSGATATSLNFHTDVNASGVVSASDIGQVKANAGHTLP